MRTTIRLDDDLLAQAKRLAVERGTTFTAVVEEALRQELTRPRAADVREPVELPVFTGGRGFQPGVDVDDSAALLELMEDGLPLHKRR